jgi:CheY-like chemotaxis protein
MERAKILIVDDDPTLRRALKIRLRASHYDTVQASDGHSAIAMAQREQPDLIILDLGLPTGDGFGVLVLLCYKKGDPQKGQPESCRSRTRAMVCRSVAMEQGLCRSTRTGRTPRAELERHFGDG